MDGFRNFLSWFFNEFFPSVDQFLKLQNIQKKAVLLIDNALSYPDEDVLSSGDIRVIFLPPNVT
jgi:DDE superfamily endonuclease.